MERRGRGSIDVPRNLNLKFPSCRCLLVSSKFVILIIRTKFAENRAGRVPDAPATLHFVGRPPGHADTTGGHAAPFPGALCVLPSGRPHAEHCGMRSRAVPSHAIVVPMTHCRAGVRPGSQPPERPRRTTPSHRVLRWSFTGCSDGAGCNSPRTAVIGGVPGPARTGRRSIVEGMVLHHPCALQPCSDLPDHEDRADGCLSPGGQVPRGGRYRAGGPRWEKVPSAGGLHGTVFRQIHIARRFASRRGRRERWQGTGQRHKVHSGWISEGPGLEPGLESAAGTAGNSKWFSERPPAVIGATLYGTLCH